MKQFVAALLIGLLLMAGCTGAPKEQKLSTFTNPVYAGTKDNLPEAPDPTAIKFNGEYYAYVTGDPCLVLKSADLVSWKLVGPMMTEQSNCWAPSVVYKNGTFYAYASTVQHGMAEGSRRVRLYTSESPTGPFLLKTTVTEKYSYDGEYFMDSEGREYLHWTQECGQLPYDCSGNANVVDELVGMEKLAGEMSFVAGAQGWECKYRCILEAPAVLERDGKFYMQYSGAAYENDSYGGAYLVSDQAAGAPWIKHERVLKTVEDHISGPGGADWVKAPNNLDDWTIYHARGITRETWDRWLRIDPVMWGQDRFWLPGAPSEGEQVAPAMPAFQDLFAGTELSRDWKTTGGAWAVSGGALRQTKAEGGARAVVTAKSAALAQGVAAGLGDAAGYVAEVNVRLLPGGAGGAAGMLLADEATVMIDAIAKELVASYGGTEARYPLGDTFRPDVYHQIIAVKNGARIALQVDGQQVGIWKAELKGEGRIGVVTEGAAAEFDGVTLTRGWEDFFDGEAILWGDAEDKTARSGEWRLENAALVGEGTTAQAFRGSRQWQNYEFTVSFRTLSQGARPGIYAAYYDKKNNVSVVIDPQKGTLTSQGVVRSKAQAAEAVDLKATVDKALDFAAYHTIRVVKNGFGFNIYLDGKLVQQRTFQLAQGQPGLLLENGLVEFDSIHAVQW
ncbi:MAG TPA: family 43 glycosylhydrolase [Symbiobacteriaceae bacterium]|nr:family 43 glycosylhydrolase [Symbiobacteriaceae bacterium]